ncbi:hypothetical protein ACFC8N_13790 [Streptomyces sp. NPDC055966]|uniref:hypothetical protein n=1 Tax=Streptomyces sp. NPDC055966 TaxID=3345669 RepID=UPI0035E00F37
MSGWWTCPDERTRREVDARVPDDRRFAAVTAVWAALRPLGPGVHEAEQVVHARYAALGDRVRSAPPDPLDVPSLAARAAAHRGRAAAIEAIWDGDTVHDWFGRSPRTRAGPWRTTSAFRSTSPPRTSLTTRPLAGARPLARPKSRERDAGQPMSERNRSIVRRRIVRKASHEPSA